MKINLVKTIFLVFWPAIALCATHSILIAGSKGFQNYHYQSSVCHFQKMLLSSGIEHDNVITISHDDLANHDMNPRKTQLFNYMSGDLPGFNIRKDCSIDYQGENAEKRTFFDILSGESANLGSRGSGKTLQSTSSDNIILYLTGNSAKGYLEFPRGEGMFADELLKQIRDLKLKKKYNKMIIFHDTSFAPTYYDFLDPSLNVLAITSGNQRNSTSWAMFCPPGNDTIAGKHIGTCLGDLFTISIIKLLYENEKNVVMNFRDLESELNRLNISKLALGFYGDLRILNDNLASYFGNAESCKKHDRIISAKHPDDSFKDYFYINEVVNNSIRHEYTRLNVVLYQQSHNQTDHSSKQLLKEIKMTQLNKLIFDAVKADLKVSGLEIVQNLNNKDSASIYTCYKKLVSLYSKRCMEFSTITYLFLGNLYDICTHTTAQADIYDALSLKLSNLCGRLSKN